LEKAFVLLLLVYVILRLTGGAPDDAVAASPACVLSAGRRSWPFRLARRGLRKAIWRLRNRLIAAYIFIAVVPVVLILLLAGHRHLRGDRADGGVPGEHRTAPPPGGTDCARRRLWRVVPVTDPSTAHCALRERDPQCISGVLTCSSPGKRELRFPPDNKISHPPARMAALRRPG
jgi:hypothetical protein